MLGDSTITDLSSIVNLADYKNKSEKLTWKAAARTPTDAPFTNCAGDCVVINFAVGVMQIAWKQPDNFDGLYVNLWWGGNVNHWSGWKKIAVTNV